MFYEGHFEKWFRINKASSKCDILGVYVTIIKELWISVFIMNLIFQNPSDVQNS